MKKVLAVTSKYAQKEVLYANSELYFPDMIEKQMIITEYN